jgi:hypothetical protein
MTRIMPFLKNEILLIISRKFYGYYYLFCLKHRQWIFIAIFNCVWINGWNQKILCSVKYVRHIKIRMLCFHIWKLKKVDLNVNKWLIRLVRLCECVCMWCVCVCVCVCVQVKGGWIWSVHDGCLCKNITLTPLISKLIHVNQKNFNDKKYVWLDLYC